MEIKYNRSLSGVPENQQQQPLRRVTKTYIENRDPVRRNLTMLYNEGTYS
jgi:cyclin A